MPQLNALAEEKCSHQRGPMGDRKITAQFGTEHNVTQKMIATLGYQKVSSQWVPHFLTDKHKTKACDITVASVTHC
jgi:hypothetical protein